MDTRKYHSVDTGKSTTNLMKMEIKSTESTRLTPLWVGASIQARDMSISRVFVGQHPKMIRETAQHMYFVLEEEFQSFLF